MAVTAPTFIQEAETSWTTTNPASQEKTFEVKISDRIVVFAIDEQAAGTLALAISGGGLTWKEEKLSHPEGECYVVVWTTTATKAESITVKVTATGKGQFGNIGRWGFNALTFRGSDGIGAVALTTGSGAPLLSISSEQENSALVVANADFAAVNGEKRKWREGAGALTEKTFSFTSGAYTVYGGYHASVGAAGKKEVGLTEPAGQTFTIVALEVKGKAEGKALSLELSDSIAFSESHSAGDTKPLSDAVSFSDSLAKSTQKTLSDSVSWSDAQAKAVTRPLSDSIMLSDSSSRSTGKTLKDTLVFADSLGKQIVHRIQDSISFSDSISLEEAAIFFPELPVSLHLAGSRQSLALRPSLALAALGDLKPLSRLRRAGEANLSLDREDSTAVLREGDTALDLDHEESELRIDV